MVGVVTFNLFKPGKSLDYSLSVGDVLILVSLLFDGLTASFQEIIRGKYQTNSYLMMYELNKWAVVILFPFILFGEGFAVVQFVLKNPEVIFMIIVRLVEFHFPDNFKVLHQSTYLTPTLVSIDY